MDWDCLDVNEVSQSVGYTCISLGSASFLEFYDGDLLALRP